MEVIFACKRFPIDQVLRCTFGLSAPEFAILKVLLSNERLGTYKIAKVLKKDRTTVQRSIKALIENRLIKRYQLNIEGGGYQYEYEAQNKEEIKEKIKKHFENFSVIVNKEIDSW